LKSLRVGILGVIAVLLMGGQAVSYWVVSQPDAMVRYYQSLENPAIKWLCWVLLIGVLVLGFMKGDDETEVDA